MKKLSLFILLVLLVAACSKPKPTEKFSYSPVSPKAGDNLEIVYYPADSSMTEEKVNTVIYFVYNDLPDIHEIEMKEDNGVYTASVKVPEGYHGALVKFTYGENTDNNDGKAYEIKIADKDGAVYQDADVALSLAKSSWGASLLDLEVNREGSLRFVSEEFHKKNASKADFLKGYFGLLSKVEATQAKSIIDDEISMIINRGNLSATEIEAILVYNDKLELGKNLPELEAKLKELDPQNSYLYGKDAGEIRNLDNIEAIMAKADELLKKYSDENAQKHIHSKATNQLYRNSDFAGIKKYIEKYPKAAIGGMLNAAAWNLAEKGTDMALAEDIAKAGLEASLNEIKTMYNKSQYTTPSDYIESQKYNLGMMYDTYAYILEQKGDLKNALEAYDKAVQNLMAEAPEVNERYAKVLISTENYQKAFDEITKFIKDGKGTPAMNDLLALAYEKVKGSKDGWDEYMASLEGEAKAKMKAELEKSILNEAAPQFTLTDLDGKEVSLADFKGQTVVVDFWATWCGPCRQSFPGMQIALDKYTDVKFLFVNTWERLDGYDAKKANAAEFIKKNNYTFHVLLDADNSVIASYKVSGIPTKFIIDKNGNIRFKSVGFGGNIDELVIELGMMFDMIK